MIERRKRKNRRRIDDPAYTGIERRVHGDRRSGGEQRSHRRYKAKETVLVAMGFGDNRGTGQLIDISRGGLALRMTVNSCLPSDHRHLDLLTAADQYRITDIPYRTVSGSDLPGPDPACTMIVRRYGLAFTALSRAQSSLLDHFLANYTFGTA